jgi:hypothetical protein
VCNLEFGKNNLVVSVKLFRDDLQLAIQHETGKIVDLRSIDDKSEEEIIKIYIFERFKILLDKKEVLEISYTGYEVNEDAVWMFFKAENPGKMKSLRLENSLLVETFHDQTNLIIMNYMGNQNGYRFNYNDRVIEPILKAQKE